MDVRFSPATFAATTISVAAVSEAGRALFAQMFGAGAVSVELPKSRASDFARFVEQKGLAVA